MTRADGVLLVLLMLGIGGLFRLYWTDPVVASQAVVTGPQGQQIVALEHDAEFHIAGAIGDSHLEVKDGAIRFVSSPCRHKICIRSGWHHNAGSVAACVPNRISVVLRGHGAEFDAISY